MAGLSINSNIPGVSSAQSQEDFLQEQADMAGGDITELSAEKQPGFFDNLLSRFKQGDQKKDKDGNVIGSNLGSSLLDYAKKQLTTKEQQDQANKEVGRDEELYQRYKTLGGISLGPVEYEKIKALQGPEARLESLTNLSPSAYENVAMDPRLKQAMLQNLDTYQKLAQSGYTPEMAAALGKIQRTSLADAASQEAAIQQQMAARGMGSSGASLALKQQAAQNALNTAAQQEQDMSSQAFRNQLQSMAQGQSAYQSMSNEELNAALQKAQGLDTSSYRGATLRADQASRNVAAQNQAARLNWQNAQDVAARNAEIQRQQELHNKYTAPTGTANIGMNAAAGQAGAGKALSASAGARAQQQDATQGLINTALTNVAGEALGSVGESVGGSVGDFISGLF